MHDLSLPSREPAPDNLALQRELLDAYEDCLCRLRAENEDWFNAVVLRNLEDLAYADIGKFSGRSHEAVNMWIFRGRKFLQQCLETKGFQPGHAD